MVCDVTLVSAHLHSKDQGFAPIGPLYLASALKARGRTLEFIDFQKSSGNNPFAFKALADLFAAAASPVVGVSLFGNNLPVALAAAEEYRRRGGTKKIVFGGPGPNGVERRLLERFTSVDVVVRGEGEGVLPDILDAFSQGRTPTGSGIFARDAAGRVQGAPPIRIPDIDVLPWPDRLLISTYNHTTAPLVTARGCPFTCSFCDIITMWGRAVGFRSIEDVVREVGAIVSTGTRKIAILDDLFTVNRKRVIAFCRALRSAGFKVKWSCTSRIDLLDDELLDEMVNAGCTCIYFGVDASTEDGWKKINKNFTRDQVLNTFKMTLKRCNAYASFIWGYPFETFADFTETINLAYDLASISESLPHSLTVQLHFLAPGSATPLFAEYGHTLMLGEALPLTFLRGWSLKSFSGVDGYAECLALIRSDPELFAPFYYYPSERLLEKLLVIRELSLPDAAARDSRDDGPLAAMRDVYALSAKVRHIRSLRAKSAPPS